MFIFSSVCDFGIFPITVILVLIIVPETRETGILCGISFLIVCFLNNFVLKNLVHRIRPYDMIQELNAIVRKPSDWSFPSGHKAIAFSIVSVIFLKTRKSIGIPVAVLAFLVGFSRLYNGVHYPMDVLGGFLIGSMAGIFTCFIWKKIQDFTRS